MTGRASADSIRRESANISSNIRRFSVLSRWEVPAAINLHIVIKTPSLSSYVLEKTALAYLVRQGA